MQVGQQPVAHRTSFDHAWKYRSGYDFFPVFADVLQMLLNLFNYFTGNIIVINRCLLSHPFEAGLISRDIKNNRLGFYMSGIGLYVPDAASVSGLFGVPVSLGLPITIATSSILNAKNQ